MFFFGMESYVKHDSKTFFISEVFGCDEYQSRYSQRNDRICEFRVEKYGNTINT